MSEDTCYDKIFMKMHAISFPMSQIMEKMPYLAMFKNTFKNILDPDPKANDFQNLISYSSSTDTCSVNFLWRSD